MSDWTMTGTPIESAEAQIKSMQATIDALAKENAELRARLYAIWVLSQDQDG